MAHRQSRADFDRLLTEARDAFNARDWGRARELATGLFRAPRPNRHRRHGGGYKPQAGVAPPEDATQGNEPLSAFATFEQFLRDTAATSEHPEALDSVLRAMRRHERPARWLDRIVSRQIARRGIDQAQLRSSIAVILEHVQEQHGAFDLTGRDGTITILFCDIAGSTRLAEQVGDERWLDVIRAHNAIVREQMVLHRGREISNRGDGFMITFLRADEAVGCAIAIQRRISSHDFGDLPGPVELHIGIHTGTPAKHEGNFYGTDVNIAARIADDIAGPGEILLTRPVCERLQQHQGVVAPACREVALDGLSDTQDVFEVRWREQESAPSSDTTPV